GLPDHDLRGADRHPDHRERRRHPVRLLREPLQGLRRNPVSGAMHAERQGRGEGRGSERPPRGLFHQDRNRLRPLHRPLETACAAPDRLYSWEWFSEAAGPRTAWLVETRTRYRGLRTWNSLLKHPPRISTPRSGPTRPTRSSYTPASR